MGQSALEKLTVAQLVKEFRTLYGTRIFITVFRSMPLDPILSHMNPVNTTS